MPGDSFCIQYTNCTGCPKNVENILVYRNLPKGEHIPKDKCTQNCMLFMIKGELLINSEEHPGITLRERQIVLQAIGSKVEILALTDVEYVVYWFNELPLLCEDRYKEMMEQAEMVNSGRVLLSGVADSIFTTVAVSPPLKRFL